MARTVGDGVPGHTVGGPVRGSVSVRLGPLRAAMAIRLPWQIGIVVAAGAVLAGSSVPPRPAGGAVQPVRPQDDLYEHVNADWVAGTPIPADRVSHTAFTELGDKVERDILGIIEEVAARTDRRQGSNAQQIADLYRSVTDVGVIEAQGAAPMREALRRIEAIESPRALAAEAGHLSAIAAGGPFAGAVGADPEDTRRLIVQVSQGGILLPERETYFGTDARSAALRTAYESYLATLFRLIDREDPRADARAVFALETELARAHQPAGGPGAVGLPRRVTFAELAREMPGFDWEAWGRPQGMTRGGAILLAQPAFFKQFAALVPTVPLDTWKSWLTTRYLTFASAFVSDAFGNARFEFFGRLLTGQDAPRPRWKRGVGLVNGYLADAVGRLYVERHFTPESRSLVAALAARVRSAFREAIAASDWMTPAARRAALAKLDALDVRIGYPEAWRDYRGLVVKPDDLLGNVQRAQLFEHRAGMARTIARDDPRHWPVGAQTVNAVYRPAANEIVLPAGILLPPFFDPRGDDALNYGALGGVIGHELTHGFDARGRRFDSTGAARAWWRRADEEAFLTRAVALADQFGAYAPLNGARVDGALTLAENVADLGGLAIAFRAYKLSLNGKPSPVIDGRSGEQRVFIGWARAWRARVRDDYLRQTLLTEPHAPARYRVNGPASNLVEFYDAFGVRPGDGLYRDPSRRVRVW